MNAKHLSFILLLFFVLLSISAVSANNETVAADVNNELGNASNPLDVGYNVSFANTSVTYGGNLNANVSGEVVNTPVFEIALKTEEDNPTNGYIDVEMDYGDYSFNIDNKNYYFSYNQGFKSNPVHNSNDFRLLDLMLFNKNNALVLNVNLLNKSNQEVELATPNFAWDLLNMLISAFYSLFN